MENDAQRSTELAAARGSDAMRDLRNALGLGPRDCLHCGKTYTPPPYMEFRKSQECYECAEKRMLEWAATPEGKSAIEKVLQTLKHPNKEVDRDE